MEGLRGKVAIVTGASSGIGAATAEQFAKYGTWLSLIGRDTERLEAVGAKCEQAGLDKNKILLISCDLLEEASLDKIVNQTVDKYDKIDILVNCAGAVNAANFESMSMDTMDANYKILLRVPVFLTQKVLPHLKITKGNIINVSSVLSELPKAYTFPYGMAKAGLDYVTKALSVELGHFGIRVNSVNPGEVKTNMQAGWGLKEEDREKYFNSVAYAYPLGRVGEPHEVAAAIVFLASDGASFVSGVTLPADGGLSNTVSWTPSELGTH